MQIRMVKKMLLFIALTAVTAGLRAQSWTRVNSIPDLDVFSLQTDHGNIYAGTIDRLYTGYNNGQYWVASAPLGAAVVVTGIKVFHGYLYVGTYTSGVFRSSDEGVSWTAVSNGISSINSIARMVVWNDELYAATYGEGIFKFDERTLQWSGFNSGLYPNINGNVNDLTTIAGTLVAAAGINGDFYRYDTTAKTWQYSYFNGTGIQAGLYPNALLADGNSLLAGFHGRNYAIMRSEDAGRSWRFDTTGLVRYLNYPLANINVIASGAAKNYIAVNTFGGTNGSNIAWILSRDKGAAAGTRWDSLTVFNTDSYAYAIAEAGGKLYVALDSGLYYRSADAGGVIPPTAGILVYPNPSRGPVHIVFNLTARQNVSVRLLDVNGQVLAVPFANYALGQGLQQLDIDLTGYSAATYLLDIVTGNGHQVKRLIKIR